MCQTNYHPILSRHARWMQVLMLAAVLLGFTACAEQPTMILIRGAAIAGSDCTLPADPGTFQSEGVLDVSLASGYLLAPNVENVAPSSLEVGAQGKAAVGTGAVWDNLSIEGNRVLITDAQVSFEAISPSLDGVLQGFEMPIGGVVIDPDGGTATFGVAVITTQQVIDLSARVTPGMIGLVIVNVRLSGITSSDTEVESNEFSFPITVCNGCLAGADCSVAQSSNRCMLPGQDVPYCPETTDG